MPTATYTKTGTKAASPHKLDPDIFGVKTLNHALLHYAYDAYLSNGRTNHALTKTRGLVRGGGRKPWRQKGLGRARVGSRRTPLWRGGGIIFGPTGNENYTKKLNQSVKRAAIVQALTSHNQAGSIRVIEELSLKSSKTAELHKLLNRLEAEGYTLIVVDTIPDKLRLAARNLSAAKVVQARYLNTARLLDADTVILSRPALNEITAWLKPKATAKERGA